MNPESVIAAFARVLMDRGHDADTVLSRLSEQGEEIEAAMWDEVFGPAADQIAGAIGLPPYPEED